MRHRTGGVAVLVALAPTQEVVDPHVFFDSAPNAVHEHQLANVKVCQRQIPTGLVVARRVPPMQHQDRGRHAVADVQLVQPQPTRFMGSVTETSQEPIHRRLAQRAGQPATLPERGVKPRHVRDDCVERPDVGIPTESHRFGLLLQTAAEPTDLLSPVRAETAFVLVIRGGEFQERHNLAHRLARPPAGPRSQHPHPRGHRAIVHPGEPEHMRGPRFRFDPGTHALPYGVGLGLRRHQAEMIARGDLSAGEVGQLEAHRAPRQRGPGHREDANPSPGVILRHGDRRRCRTLEGGEPARDPLRRQEDIAACVGQQPAPLWRRSTKTFERFDHAQMQCHVGVASLCDRANVRHQVRIAT